MNAKSTSINIKQLDIDICCYRYGCFNKSTEKIEVNAGSFGNISLKLCPQCVTKFKPQEI